MHFAYACGNTADKPNFIKVTRSGGQNKSVDLEAMHTEKVMVVVKMKKKKKKCTAFFKGAENRILQNSYISGSGMQKTDLGKYE